MAKTEGPWGIGIVGYEIGRSWAAVAHVPAIRGLPDFNVTAVATTREASAHAAAADIGTDNWFTSADQLVACPQVDIVVITVKVPFHDDLVRRAVAAGKHVYCEWPLGNGLVEAAELAALVRSAGLRDVVGLQARCAPTVMWVRDMIAAGEIGEVLSTTMTGTGGQWGDWVDPANTYVLDKSNGATLLTIPFGHAVDAMCHCLGEFRDISALMAIRQPAVRQIETGEILQKTSADQIALTGTLDNGAVAVVHYRGGTCRGTNFLWEISGTKGELRIEADSGHAQIAGLRISGGFGEDRKLQPMTIPARYRWAPAGIAGAGVNVAQLYALFSQDLRNGTRTAPGFADALQRHRMIAAIEEAAQSGHRVSL